MIDASKIVNAIDFKPALDKMADILEDELKKSTYESGLMRVMINGKVKLINNYSYVIEKEKANSIIASMFESVENEYTRQLLKKIIPKNFNSNVEINIYASINGFEQLVFTYDGIRVKISPQKDGSYIIIYDYYNFKINKTNNGLYVTIKDTEANTESKLEYKWENTSTDNGAKFSLTVECDDNGIPSTLNVNSEFKSVASSNLQFPGQFTTANNDTVLERYNSEYNFIKPYFDQLNLLNR